MLVSDIELISGSATEELKEVSCPRNLYPPHPALAISTRLTLPSLPASPCPLYLYLTLPCSFSLPYGEPAVIAAVDNRCTENLENMSQLALLAHCLMPFVTS